MKALVNRSVLERGGIGEMTPEKWEDVAKELEFHKATESLIHCLRSNYVGEFGPFEK